jgi:diadenylate cyclase
MWPALTSIGWRDLIEIGIIWILVYQVLLFLKESRAFEVAKGLALLIITALLCQVLKLNAIGWVLRNLLALGLVTFIIIFQPELRRALARIGRGPFTGITFIEEGILEELVKAVSFLSPNRIGALIVIERDMGLRNYLETGVIMEANLSSSLLISIFMPHTPLHDGAVIVQGDKIVAAGCILPVVEDGIPGATLGTRHRAAIGITRETDALAIVVSEENGSISLATGGKLDRNLEFLTLKEALKNIYLSSKKRRPFTRYGKK